MKTWNILVEDVKVRGYGDHSVRVQFEADAYHIVSNLEAAEIAQHCNVRELLSHIGTDVMLEHLGMPEQEVIDKSVFFCMLAELEDEMLAGNDVADYSAIKRVRKYVSKKWKP